MDHSWCRTGVQRELRSDCSRSNLALSLIPFGVTAAAHFALSDGVSTPSLFYCILKCSPIMALMIFVARHGRIQESNALGAFSTNILIGLGLSVIGDAVLVFDYFKFGTVAFAAAHIFYTLAFGFRPTRPLLGAICAAVVVAIFLVIRSGLSGSLLYLVPAYMLVIGTMVWRASARVRAVDCQNGTGRLWGCIGAIFFWISDGIIAVDKFKVPIPYGHTLDMATYYVGQLGIALTTVDAFPSSGALNAKGA